MGSYRWVFRQTLVGTDGIAKGMMEDFKTFPPFFHLHLAHCGIFRDARREQKPLAIEDPIWVDDNGKHIPGYFVVDLPPEFREGTIAELTAAYGARWQWTFFPPDGLSD